MTFLDAPDENVRIVREFLNEVEGRSPTRTSPPGPKRAEAGRLQLNWRHSSSQVSGTPGAVQTFHWEWLRR